MAPCLSVRPFVRHNPVQIWKRLVELSRFLAILGYHEIVIRFGYLQNKDTSLQTLSDILDFENFAPIVLPMKLVDGRACGPHLRRIVAV